MVTEKDCIESIKDYPPYVVELMLDEQERQGNPRNVAVFQAKADAGYFEGGFSWNKSLKGPMFWSNIHNGKKFDIASNTDFNSRTCVSKDTFKGTIEQEDKEEGFVLGAPVMVNHGGRVLEKRLLGVVNNNNSKVYICVTNNLYNLLLTGNANRNSVSSYTEGVELIRPERQKIKLTLKDISEGKGVGIPPELIQIID